MKVIMLEPEGIMRNWKEIEGAIDLALSHSVGESTTYTYLRKLSDPAFHQCWVVLDDNGKAVNISVTRINQYDTHKSLHLLTTTGINGGSWKSYKEAHHTIEQFAKDQGCRRIEFYGREGWVRMITKLVGSKGEKYKPVYQVYSMEVNNE